MKLSLRELVEMGLLVGGGCSLTGPAFSSDFASHVFGCVAGAGFVSGCEGVGVLGVVALRSGVGEGHGEGGTRGVGTEGTAMGSGGDDTGGDGGVEGRSNEAP